MTTTEFNKIVRTRCNLINEVLTVKAKEYSRDNNRLHNFDRASVILNTTREKALLGMAVKHLISFLDLVNDMEKEIPTTEYIDEKIGDLINYLILCEASIKDKINK